MNFDIKRVKIITTIPTENTESVRNAICDEGAGVIGNYTHCTMSTKCIGTFKPNDEANIDNNIPQEQKEEEPNNGKDESINNEEQ